MPLNLCNPCSCREALIGLANNRTGLPLTVLELLCKISTSLGGTGAVADDGVPTTAGELGPVDDTFSDDLPMAGDSELKVLVRAGPIIVKGWQFMNTATTPFYLQMFDAAAIAAVTLGTTPPKIQPAYHDGQDANFYMPGGGVGFDSGLVIAATTLRTGSVGLDARLDLTLFIK